MQVSRPLKVVAACGNGTRCIAAKDARTARTGTIYAAVLVLIIAGTSLAVYPAAGLVNYYRGHKLVVINKTPLGYRTNRIIGGVAPSEYLSKLDAERAAMARQIAAKEEKLQKEIEEL